MNNTQDRTQMEDVNCDPLSEVMTEGTPNRGTKYLSRAPAHSEAVIDLTGKFCP